MLFTSYSEKKYFLLLKKGEESISEYPHLPAGVFCCRFTVRNPSAESYELVVKVTDDAGNSEEHRFQGDKMVVEQELTIEKRSDKFASPIRVSFRLFQGKDVGIRLPVSPMMTSAVKMEKQNYLSAVNKVKNALSENSGPLTDNQPHPVNPFFNLKSRESLLTLRQAEEQLDFVIYQKMFVPDGSRGFVKKKRALYRRLVRFTYRKLVKNTVRKRYIAKLYRNYVNLNTLFES